MPSKVMSGMGSSSMPGVPKANLSNYNPGGAPKPSSSGGVPQPVNPGSGPYKGYLDAANIQMRDPIKDAREIGGIARQQFESQLASLAGYQQKGANVAGYQQRQTQGQALKGQSWDNYVSNSNAANQTANSVNQAKRDANPMGKTSSYSGSKKDPFGKWNAGVTDYKARKHEKDIIKLGQAHEQKMAYQGRVDSNMQAAAERAHQYKLQGQQTQLEYDRLGSQERQTDKQLQGDMYKNYTSGMAGMAASFNGGGGSFGGYW